MEPGYSLWMELWPASMEPEFALRMELRPFARAYGVKAASMEPEFALRMEPVPSGPPVIKSSLQWSRSLHSGWNSPRALPLTRAVSFNGAGVCTPDGTGWAIDAKYRETPSMEPEFALRMERRDAHQRADYPIPSMEPEFALRMELFPQNSKGKQALQTAFSSTRTERANLPFHPARGKKKFLYSC